MITPYLGTNTSLKSSRERESWQHNIITEFKLTFHALWGKCVGAVLTLLMQLLFQVHEVENVCTFDDSVAT